MTLIQFIGGIALLVIGGGALIALLLTSLWSDIRRNPLKHGGDEHSKTLGIGGESFIHGEPTK